MPKSIVLKPDTLLAEDRIRFTDIPVNIYSKTIEEERSVFAPQDFLAIWQDMAAIREFETILSEIKTKRLYKGVAYDHLGPAHLSIGQEASAVGMAFLLTPDDHIYGSHRSHGEILAKGFSAIRKTDEQTLLEIMRTYLDGAILRPLEKDHRGSVADLAIKFVIFGAFSELFAKETGFNRGMGGSMHAFFTPFGSYPNNAIVGGSGSIAPGAALFKRVNRKRGIIVANIGDASFGCGPVWEGLTFASMDQYRTLWDPELGGGLPILFNCMNNQYGMGGQPLGETMGCRFIARIGAAVNPEQLHAERVNGYDPLALIDAFRRKIALLAEGKGPALLDAVTYRISGHSPSDASSYRTKEEVEAWQQADSLLSFRDKLVRGGVFPDSTLDETRAGIESVVFQMFQLAIDPQAAPRIGIDSDLVGRVMFSNGTLEKCDDRKPELLQELVAELAGATDQGPDPNPGARRQAGAEDEGVQRPRRDLRSPGPSLQHRSDDGGVRRREPRLGRGVRRLSRPDRGAPVSSPVQRAHLGSRHRRAPPSATRWKAGGRWRSSCTPISWAGPAMRSSISSRSGRRCPEGSCGCRSSCASRSASSTARNTRRIGVRWSTTFRGSRSSTRSRPTTPRA